MNTAPTIDFNDLLSDPDLAQWFTITRFLQVVDQSGETQVFAQEPLSVYGIVQPAPPETTALYLPEGERTNTNISVWTTLPLNTGVDGTAADVLGYNGQRYRVMKTTHWTHAGVFYNAFCVQIPP